MFFFLELEDPSRFLFFVDSLPLRRWRCKSPSSELSEEELLELLSEEELPDGDTASLTAKSSPRSCICCEHHSKTEIVDTIHVYSKNTN